MRLHVRNQLAWAGVTASSTFLWQNVVVQPCEVDKLLAARLAHRQREEDHREIIRACSQPMQKTTIGQAHVVLHRDDSRLLKTPEPSIVAWVLLASPMDDFYHAQFRQKEYAWTKVGYDILQTTSTSKETLDLVVGPPQLGRVHTEYGPNSRHELARGQSNNLCVSMCLSVLTRSSATAADGGTPDTNGGVKAKSTFHTHRSRNPLRPLCVGRWKDSKWCDKFTSCNGKLT